MLCHSLFGIFLHLVVYGRVDPEAVPVKVVLASVRLAVLLEPAVEAVVRPEQRVGGEILRVLVLGTFRGLRVHVAAEHLPEVRGVAGVVVLDLVFYHDGQPADGIEFGLAEVARLLHLLEYEVPPVEGLLGIEGGVVPGRLVDHSDEGRRLLDGQVGRSLREEGVRSRLDAICIAAEEHRVEVHVNYLVLGVVPLEFDGGDPLLELDEDHPDLGQARYPASHVGSRIEGLGELLGYGRAASLAGVAHQYGLDRHTAEGLNVYAGVLVEAFVLSRNRRLHKVRGQFVIACERTVLDVEGGENLAVLRDYLGRELGVRVFQFLEGRYVGKCPYQRYAEENQDQRTHRHYPDPLHYSLSARVSHIRQKKL